MVLSNCPGSQKFRQPEPEIIKCSSCGSEVEIWTDEIKAVCPNCNKTLIRESGTSCFDWCKYAKECAGDEVYSKYMKNKAVSMKHKLIKELENYFGADEKRIKHAKKVLSFAQKLLEKEKADWHIVIPASILHDVGIKVAEEKYGSAAGNLQEKEGPPVARNILTKSGLKKEDIDEICEIIANHHSPDKVNTLNFKVLYDADWLVNICDEVDTKDKNTLRKVIDKVFLTDTGREFAKKTYLE